MTRSGEQSLRAEIEAAAEKFRREWYSSRHVPNPSVQELMIDFALSQVHAQIERDAEILEEEINKSPLEPDIQHKLRFLAKKIRAQKG